MKSHAFHPAARAEFEADIRFYAIERSGWGQRFTDAVLCAVHQACTFPGSGSEYRDGIRMLVTKDFPFVIFYELVDETIVIWAVMHGARRPDYWKSRRQPPLHE